MIQIYTDGSVSGNPGPGGWAAVILHNKEQFEIGGGEKLSTNNRMEMQAVIGSLKYLKDKKVTSKITIHSDSAYIVNCINKGWYRRWRKNGWLNSSNNPVENQDLWNEMLDLFEETSARIRKVKGHSGNKWNEVCDGLAKAEVKKIMQN